MHEQHHLRPSINLAMHKVKPVTFTTGTVEHKLKGTTEMFVVSDNVFSFVSSVKGKPTCWKQFLYDILATVKQLRISKHFLMLSCGDLRWKEIPYFINKLSNLALSDEKIEYLSYQKRCNMLNKNPVIVARHLLLKLDVFLKDIILNGPLGETKYCAIRIEFQERCSPHLH